MSVTLLSSSSMGSAPEAGYDVSFVHVSVKSNHITDHHDDHRVEKKRPESVPRNVTRRNGRTIRDYKSLKTFFSDLYFVP